MFAFFSKYALENNEMNGISRLWVTSQWFIYVGRKLTKNIKYFKVFEFVPSGSYGNGTYWQKFLGFYFNGHVSHFCFDVCSDYSMNLSLQIVGKLN